MDPIVATLVTSFVSSIFTPPAAAAVPPSAAGGVSAAQLQSILDAQRAAIVLVDMDGFSVADASDVLGVPIGTVKSRCARGRARLAVMLGHMRNPDAPVDVSSVKPRNVATGQEAQA